MSGFAKRGVKVFPSSEYEIIHSALGSSLKNASICFLFTGTVLKWDYLMSTWGQEIDSLIHSTEVWRHKNREVWCLLVNIYRKFRRIIGVWSVHKPIRSFYLLKMSILCRPRELTFFNRSNRSLSPCRNNTVLVICATSSPRAWPNRSPFRQLYQETVSDLQMEAALVDLGHKSAFDLLLKEAWNPEQASQQPFL